MIHTKQYSPQPVGWVNPPSTPTNRAPIHLTGHSLPHPRLLSAMHKIRVAANNPEASNKWKYVIRNADCFGRVTKLNLLLVNRLFTQV